MDLQQKARAALLGILQSIHMDEKARQEAILSITWRQATNGEVDSDEPVFLIGSPDQSGYEDHIYVFALAKGWRRTVQ